MPVFAGGTRTSDHWLQFDIQKRATSALDLPATNPQGQRNGPSMSRVKSDIEIDGIDHEHGNKSFPSFDADGHASPKIGFAEAETVHCGRDPCTKKGEVARNPLLR